MMTSGYATAKIGGHNLIKYGGVFSHDGKLYLVPTDATVHVFLATSGTLVRVLRVDQESSDIGPFIYVQLSPEKPEQQLIAFSVDGKVAVFDYANSGKSLSVARLPLGHDKHVSKQIQLAFGRAFKHVDFGSDSTKYLVYYGIKGDVESVHCVECATLLVKTETTRPLRSAKKSKTANKKGPDDDSISVLGTAALVELRISRDPKWSVKRDYVVDFGPNGEYIAVGYENRLGGTRLLPRKIKHEKALHMFAVAENNPGVVAIACHPRDPGVLALGDASGRIFLYHQFLDEKRPVRSLLHWHQHSIGALAFSPNGAYLYSGGVEGVLVRWSMDSTGEKNLLPRLGVAINQLSCDRKNRIVAVAHADNSLQFVSTDLTRNDHVVVSSLINAQFGTSCEAANYDIAYHSLSDALILNASRGHLQFYSHTLQQLLYRVDIVQRNYVPAYDPQNKVRGERRFSRFSVTTCRICRYLTWSSRISPPARMASGWPRSK